MKHKIDTNEGGIRDLAEDRISFFDKDMQDFENEISINNGATKEFTSLKYF
jgi:hypothetical protein